MFGSMKTKTGDELKWISGEYVDYTTHKLIFRDSKDVHIFHRV